MPKVDTCWYKPVMHIRREGMSHVQAMGTIQAFHPRLIAMLQRLNSSARPISSTLPIGGRFTPQVVHIIFQGSVSFQKRGFASFRMHYAFQA